MAKRKPPNIGKCVHCLLDNLPRNWDHVFPESWYPDSTPENTSKWIVPSCYKCNNEYGQLEQDLMMRLACSIDSQLAQASGIYPKVLRSLSSSSAKNLLDAKHREARKNKLLSKLMHGADIPKNGIYPGLGERWGRPLNEQVALTISKVSVERLCEKIIRGIYYIEDNKFIEPPYKVIVHALTDIDALEFNSCLDQFGLEYKKPGILIKRAVTGEDGVSGLASIRIWGILKMYAIIDNKEIIN